MTRENPPQAVDGDGLRHIAEFCRVGLERTGMDGMVVMFQTSATGLEVLYATDELAERAAQIELVLGEGANLDAVRTSQPTMAEDLDHPVVHHRWP